MRKNDIINKPIKCLNEAIEVRKENIKFRRCDDPVENIHIRKLGI